VSHEIPDDQELTALEFHTAMAKGLFNHTWTLLDMDSRTIDQDDEMISAAHASRYHWMQIGENLHAARGEWQLSRVYSVLGRGEPATYHGHRCLDITHANDIGGFDLAFAHEAVARAAAVTGDSGLAAAHLALADAVGQEIPDAGDRDYFFEQLATIPVVEPD